MKIHIVDFTGHDTVVRQVVASISEESTGPLPGSIFVWTTQNHAPQQLEIKLLFLFKMLGVSAWSGNYKVCDKNCLKSVSLVSILMLVY